MSTETMMEEGSIEAAVEAILPQEESMETEKEVTAEQPETEEEVDVTESETSEEVEEEESDDTDEDEGYEIDDEGEADQVEPETFTVKVDGEEVSVTLDDLKQDFSGQKYIQKGMQEAAAQRKQAEEVYQNLLRERQQVAQLFQQMQQGGIPQAPTPPSDALIETDPVGYMQDKARFDKEMGAYQQKMAQVQQVVQQQTEAEQRAQQAYAQQEAQKLAQIIPEFADKAKAPVLKKKLLSVGSEVYGYSAEELSSTMDHRAIQVLHDAMKYREIIAGKSKAEKKTKSAKPVIKAGAKKVENPKAKARKKQRARFNKTGSIDDALDLIMSG